MELIGDSEIGKISKDSSKKDGIRTGWRVILGSCWFCSWLFMIAASWDVGAVVFSCSGAIGV